MIVNIEQIKYNDKNPRVIKDYKFQKLVKSIKDFPEMLEKRPIVVDENMVVLGGNMRLRACVEAGFKKVNIIKAEGWTEKQKEQFIIKDNSSFGDWDWDILANEWNIKDLEDWGLDFPFETEEKKISEEKSKVDNYVDVVVVVAKNINELDQISSLYNLECVDMNDDVKTQLNKKRKMYVFKK